MATSARHARVTPNPPGPDHRGRCCATTAAPAVDQRITMEDFSFPSAYVDGRQSGLRRHPRRGHRWRAMRTRRTAALAARLQTLRARCTRPTGRMNHTMLYLVHGAGRCARRDCSSTRRGASRDGRMRIAWDEAGPAADLHPHERRDCAGTPARWARNFIANPTWSIFDLRPPGHRPSAGRLPAGRRLPARRRRTSSAACLPATAACTRACSWPTARWSRRRWASIRSLPFPRWPSALPSGRSARCRASRTRRRHVAVSLAAHRSA